MNRNEQYEFADNQSNRIEFAHIESIISAHTNSAIAKVNAEALQTYWEVGEYISQRLKSSAWGTHIVDELADYLKRHNPHRRGYSKRNLYNMVKFFDTYSVADFPTFIGKLELDEFVQSQTAQLISSPIVQLARLFIPETVMQHSLAEYCEYLKNNYSEKNNDER